MSDEKIITQSLSDDIGSVYTIDGKCYVKTRHGGGGTPDTPIVEDGEVVKDTSKLVSCEDTKNSSRKATISSGGGHVCWGDITSLENNNYISTMYNIPDRQGWVWAPSLGDDEPAPIVYNRDHAYDPNPRIPNREHPSWHDSSLQFCRVRNKGHLAIHPVMPIHGVDKVRYWADRNLRWWRYNVARHYIDFRDEATQEWGYSGIDDNLAVYRGTGPAFSFKETLDKWHNTRIDGIKIRFVFNWIHNRRPTQLENFWIHALHLFKDGKRVPYADQAVTLRSKPAVYQQRI